MSHAVVSPWTRVVYHYFPLAPGLFTYTHFHSAEITFQPQSAPIAPLCEDISLNVERHCEPEGGSKEINYPGCLDEGAQRQSTAMTLTSVELQIRGWSRHTHSWEWRGEGGRAHDTTPYCAKANNHNKTTINNEAVFIGKRVCVCVRA